MELLLNSHLTCGKQKGGGLAILVNNWWCNPVHITMKERSCCPDIELCALELRPCYLPREFTHVYAAPSASPTAACDTVHSAMAQ